VNNERYYKILGVEKNATETDIKKAHRKAALIHHPDKGGDEEKFKEINEAYDVLRDSEKRRLYDQYGEDGLENNTKPVNIFEQMFGMHVPRQQKQQQNSVHKLQVGLDEMYVGKVRKIQVTRSNVCDTCRGIGSKSGKRYMCEKCNGSGIETMMRPIGPGMMQQIQQHCRKCNGKKDTCPPSDMCLSCHGQKIVSHKKICEVNIQPGHSHDAHIVFPGEAGTESPDVPPGDLIFILEQQQHPTFRRVRDALIMEKTIPLYEALCGTSFQVPTLDGRTLDVYSDGVITPGSWACVRGEGMPVLGRSTKGDLYIHFTLDFPKEKDTFREEFKNAFRETFDATSPERHASHKKLVLHVDKELEKM
jgi:DnaJ family protein A protein 2